MSPLGFGGPPDIAKLEAKRDAKGIIKACTDGNEGIRAAALAALARLDDPRAIAPICEALIDGDLKTSIEKRAAAVEALGRSWRRDCEDGLLALITICAVGRTGEGPDREAAIAALERIGGGAVENLVVLGMSDDDGRVFAVEVLGRIGKPAVDGLIATVGSRTMDGCRVTAIRALGKIGDPRAVEALTAALKDRNPEVRKGAEEALKTIAKD
jgi:HEAT repeat protein